MEGRQIDRQTDRQTGRQADMQTDGDERNRDRKFTGRKGSEFINHSRKS